MKLEWSHHHKGLQIPTNSVQVTTSVCSTYMFAGLGQQSEYTIQNLPEIGKFQFCFHFPPTCINRKLERGPGMWKVCQGAILLGTLSLGSVLCAKSVSHSFHNGMEHAQPLNVSSFVIICTNVTASAMILIMGTSANIFIGFLP